MTVVVDSGSHRWFARNDNLAPQDGHRPPFLNLDVLRVMYMARIVPDNPIALQNRLLTQRTTACFIMGTFAFGSRRHQVLPTPRYGRISSIAPGCAGAVEHREVRERPSMEVRCTNAARARAQGWAKVEQCRSNCRGTPGSGPGGSFFY